MSEETRRVNSNSDQIPEIEIEDTRKIEGEHDFENIEDFAERKIIEITSKVESLKAELQEKDDAEAAIIRLDTILRNFKNEVAKALKQKNPEKIIKKKEKVVFKGIKKEEGSEKEIDVSLSIDEVSEPKNEPEIIEGSSEEDKETIDLQKSAEGILDNFDKKIASLTVSENIKKEINEDRDELEKAYQAVLLDNAISDEKKEAEIKSLTKRFEKYLNSDFQENEAEKIEDKVTMAESSSDNVGPTAELNDTNIDDIPETSDKKENELERSKVEAQDDDEVVLESEMPSEVEESMEEVESVESLEEESDQSRLARLGEKLKGFGRGTKEVLGTSAGRNMVAKGAYDTLTTVAGVKFATDLVSATVGKGDIYNWLDQRRSTKVEKGEIMDTINDPEIENAQEAYREKINNSENLSTKEKAELLNALDKIMEEHETFEEKLIEERNEKIQQALNAYLQNKIKGAKIAKDAMYLALTATGFHLTRGAIYFMTAGIERAQKASQQFDKDKINSEAEGKSRIDEILQDVFVNSAKETFNALRGKGKKEGSEHKTMDRVQALGTLARAAGIIATGAGGPTFDVAVDDLLEDLEDKGFVDTMTDNLAASAERGISNVGKLKSITDILTDEKTYEGTIENLESIVEHVREEGVVESSKDAWESIRSFAIDKLNLDQGASDKEVAEAIEDQGGLSSMVPWPQEVIDDAKESAVSATSEEISDSTEAQIGIKQGPTETGEPLGGVKPTPEVQGPPAPEAAAVESGEVEKPLHFEDTIDSSGVKGSDSIWKSAKAIFEKNASQFGYEGDSEDASAISKWAETQTANAVAVLNEEQGGNLADLVHDGDKVMLDIVDGKAHLSFEASSGIEAENLSDTNIAKLVEGQEFKEDVRVASHIDAETGDEYVEINDGEDTYKIYDWDRDGRPNVIMPDGSEQEMEASQLQDLLGNKDLIYPIEGSVLPSVEEGGIPEPVPAGKIYMSSELTDSNDGGDVGPSKTLGMPEEENLPKGNFESNPDLPQGIKLSISEGVEKFLEDHKIEFKEGKLIGLKNVDKLSFDTVGEGENLRKVEFVHFFEEGDGSLRVEVIGGDKIDNFKINQDLEWSKIEPDKIINNQEIDDLIEDSAIKQ